MNSGTIARKASSLRQNWMLGTEIGLLEGGCRLNCSINLTERSFIYFKSTKEVIASLAAFDKRVKRWAFRRIQNHSHYQKENSRSVFLPE